MSNDSEWVSLRQAAEILGVHPATVRNWADKGELRSRRTPGGHRRFLKSDLLQYTHSQEDLQPLEIQVIIQNALGQTRMQVNDGELADLPWYSAMSQQTRQRMREEGRQVLDALRQYMAQGAPESGLSQAITLGKDYAAILSADGLTLPQAVRGFFFFSNFVINSILTWSELAQPRNSSEWANLLRQVNNFIHAMLLSIIEYYEEE
ncbi:MAG: helix-turn-helix domain-containing protein [Chloroflexi bacterium]|nr:MAG: helix-turn-helix domain-containing protein [Chloroflexota bacterium]